MFLPFQFLGKTFAIYPIMALLGLFAAGIFACTTAKKKGYDDNDMIVLLLIACVGALIGSHLLYGLLNLELFFQYLTHLNTIRSLSDLYDPLLIIFGGAVFYGGLLGGIAAGSLYAHKKKFDILAYGDMIAPAVPLFHVFGRIGCFLGGCCYGVESKIGFIYKHSPIAMANGVCRFPIQLVEALFNLLLFIFLFYLQKKGVFQKKLFCLYLLIYAIGRFILEFWRGDDFRGFLFGISTSQIISLIIILVVSIFLLTYRGYKKSI